MEESLDGQPATNQDDKAEDEEREPPPPPGKDLSCVPRDEAVDRVMAEAEKPLRASQIAFRMINRGFMESDNLRNDIFMLLRRRPEKYKPIKNGTSTLWQWIKGDGKGVESDKGE